MRNKVLPRCFCKEISCYIVVTYLHIHEREKEGLQRQSEIFPSLSMYCLMEDTACKQINCGATFSRIRVYKNCRNMHTEVTSPKLEG